MLKYCYNNVDYNYKLFLLFFRGLGNVNGTVKLCNYEDYFIER